jgi:hypothetical protein
LKEREPKGRDKKKIPREGEMFVVGYVGIYKLHCRFKSYSFSP